MITIQNYFEKKTLIDWTKIDDTTKKSLEDTELLIQTAIDVPESLEVEEIKTEIAIFLSKVNKHLKKGTATSTSQNNGAAKKVKRVTRSKGQPKKKTTKKVVTKPLEKIIDIKMVDHYSIEYRLIRRFYNLIRLNTTTTFRKIKLVYAAFQKASLDRSIRKTNAAADLFTKVNEKVVALFDAVSPTKSDATIDFTDKKLFAEMETFVKGQKVNYAVTLLKSYIAMQGLKPEHDKVQRLLKRIENAIDKQRVTKQNRLYKEVITAKSSLETYLSKPTMKIASKQIGLSKPASNVCVNRVKCNGLKKDGTLKKGYHFTKGGSVVRSKKKAV